MTIKIQDAMVLKAWKIIDNRIVAIKPDLRTLRITSDIEVIFDTKEGKFCVTRSGSIYKLEH